MTDQIKDTLEFIHLEERLREFCQGRRLLFVVNPGNWGDAMIHQGTLRFLRENKFEFQMMRMRQALNASDEKIKKWTGQPDIRILFSGNGAFLPQYHQTKTLPELIARSAQTFILPSTYSLDPKEVGLREHDIAFRRDQFNSAEHAPDLAFCHDMAFYLGRIVGPAPTQKEGYFLRQDGERVKGTVFPVGNRDLSKEGRDDTPISGFLAAISDYERIHTNRLHVAIGAALLGREVHLYANSYFKNEAIFRTSLEPFFENVHFHGDSAAMNKKMAAYNKALAEEQNS